jgi:hypothetical protein
MSAPPDVLADTLHAFVRRLRGLVFLTRAGEALLAANVTALVVLVAVTIASPGRPAVMRLLPAVSAGALVAAGLLVWRRRDWSRERVVARAEATLPGLRNHLVTALELEAHPERASARIRAHVVSQASALVNAAPRNAVQPLGRGFACAVASLVITFALPWIARMTPSMHTTLGRTSDASVARRDPAAPAGIARVDVDITPPAYTGGAPTTVTNPERVDVLAGSRLTVRVTSRDTVAVALGDVAESIAESQGVQRAVFTPAASAVLTITARRESSDVDRRLVPVIVRPDTPPEVTIDRPRGDLTFEAPAGRVTIAARASDDLGLSTLTLHYTKVTGSGEQYSFKEGELPLAITRERPTAWRGEVTRELASLDLQDGDLLVYYASAADRRPGAERAVSDSYVIEIGKPHTAIAGGFAVPLEEDKAAISMSALLAKTERLHVAKPRLTTQSYTDQTAGLAVEQRMVRSETLFLMGAHGEVEDEEAEAEHSNEIQEGRLENRGQADLREATRLMSAAERSLLVADTGAALPSQRAALAAMQRAMSKQRYFLRTLPVRSQIDLTRRLSGELGEARPWSRGPTRSADDPRAENARRLLGDIASWVDARGGRTALASEFSARLLALDPASPALQAASRDLTRLGRPGVDWAASDTRDALSRIVSAVRSASPEAGAAVPAPAALSSGALRGALADAQRREGASR